MNFQIKRKILILFINLFILVGIVFSSFIPIFSQELVEEDDIVTPEDTLVIDVINNNFEEILLIKELEDNNYSLSLEDSLNMAVENNSIFNIKKNENTIFKIRAVKSFTEMLPTFNTSMEYSYSTKISTLGDDYNFFIPTIGNISFAGFEVDKRWKRENRIFLNQPLTTLIKLAHRYKISRFESKKSNLDKELSGNELFYEVYKAYFEVLNNKYQIEAALKNIDELESLYKLTYAQYEQGKSLLRDAQKVEVELDRARYNKFVADNQLAESFSSFKSLLDIPFESSVEIKTDYEPIDTIVDLENLQNIAVENNQEVKKHKINIDIARQAKREALAEYIPDADFRASYVNQTGNEYVPANNYVFSFNLYFQIFNWGKRELTIKERQLQIENSKLAYENFIKLLKNEVQKTRNDLLESKELIKVSEKALNLAEENLNISSNRYKVGYELITDVLADQSDLAKARSDYYSSLYTEQITVARLKQILGLLYKDNSK